jgi:DNA-binding LytR/AlgR family response regulator
MSNPQAHTKLRCLAIDDEPFALKLIADDIGKVPFLALTGTYNAPLDGLEFLRKNLVDLLFLDIQMPVLKGTEFLRSLQQPPLVIITTAYEKYALEGYELNVVDYLLKPIPFDRFLKAANRAYDQFMLRNGVAQLPSKSISDSFFFVHSEYKEIKIFHDDILYVEGLKDYVKIFLQSQQRPILTRLNLKGIESRLLPEYFCRIHNSFIVSLPKIDSIQKLQIFIGKITIPIGERFAEDFRKKYKSTQ